MPEHPHLILPRAQINLERRKKPGYGSRPPREHKEHSEKIRIAVEGALAHKTQVAAAGIDPSLIIKVKTSGVVPEEEWERAGLVVLGSDEDETVILFATDGDLTEFRRRLGEYSKDAPEGQKAPSYTSLLGAIEEFSPLSPEDRIGPRLREDDITTSDNFANGTIYRLDVELWQIGDQPTRNARINVIENFLGQSGGTILDRYVGRTLTLFRVSAPGQLIRWLFDLDDVALIDSPPVPDVVMGEVVELTLADLDAATAPPADAPQVAILDTGLATSHPLMQAAIGTAIGIPAEIGAVDVKGHGTKVGGIALYGDVAACATERDFSPELVIHSAKVVKDNGAFDDVKLVPSLMRDAIVTLSRTGCRVFNISLGDRKTVYAGGKPGPWAAVLDDLSRELNVVITVSAGNFRFNPTGNDADRHVTAYPGYLLSPESRLLEPAMAAIPITVGSLARTAAVPGNAGENVGVRPVAGIEEPSPFTRSGPGVEGAIKPELCDFGGNLLFDGTANNVVNREGCTVITLNHQYLNRLLTGDVGTSLAAPAVAYKAAQVLKTFPQASANLVRALLASSASVPAATENRLNAMGEEAVRGICGYGVADVRYAVSSDDNRVVLYDDNTIPFDYFYVYEVPVPPEFVTSRGRRRITVTLAFDPPTRHTRIDYLGARMSFRLVRGQTLEQVREHYRRRDADEEKFPKIDGSLCDTQPTPTIREKGTLQKATFTMAQNPKNDYGDTYYLVVRCERKWAPDEEGPQRFALVVEMAHQADIRLYERVRERVRLRLRT